MVMRKCFTILTSIFIMITNTWETFGQEIENGNVIEVSYEVLSKNFNKKVFIIDTKLKSRNNSSDSIYNVTVKILDNGGAFINYGEHYFGDIDSKETVISTGILTISFDYSTQETPEIVWQVEYDDIDGNKIIETLR